MDLSGVLFVVLAVVWAAYLLPKALRHHDEVAKRRSVEEVSEQARVVVTPPGRPERRPGRVRRARAAAGERSAALTPAGRAAFLGHVAALEEVLAAARTATAESA